MPIGSQPVKEGPFFFKALARRGFISGNPWLDRWTLTRVLLIRSLGGPWLVTELLMACATPKFSGTGGKGGPQKDFAGRLVVFFLSANLTATHASKLWPRGSRVRVWLQDLLLTMGRKRLAEARKVASQHRAAMARKGLLALERQAQLKAQNGADAGADLGSTVSHSRFVSFSRFFFFLPGFLHNRGPSNCGTISFLPGGCSIEASPVSRDWIRCLSFIK